MFDANKIQDTLDSLRSNATLIRNQQNLGEVQPAVLELLLLRAHADLTSCASMLQQLAAERDALKAEQNAQKQASKEGPDPAANDD